MRKFFQKLKARFDNLGAINTMEVMIIIVAVALIVTAATLLLQGSIGNMGETVNESIDDLTNTLVIPPPGG